jgi:hypothetical protein
MGSFKEKYGKNKKKKEDIIIKTVEPELEKKTEVETARHLNKAGDEYLALEELKTEKFINTARDFYNYREETDEYTSMNAADILEKFYDDRTWGNYNTVSMGADVLFTGGEENKERLAQFAYIQQTYARLPSFWNDPNRSFGSWLSDAGAAMVADPVNLIGLGVGRVAAKEAFSLTLKEQLKGKMAKEVEEKIIHQITREANEEAFGRAVKKGAVYEGAIGGAIVGAQDALLQHSAIYSNAQEEYNLGQTAVSTLAGGAFGTMFGAAGSAFSFKLTSKQMNNTAIKQLKDLHDYGIEGTSGRPLFNDLLEVKPENQLYKNLSVKEKKDLEIKRKSDLDLEGDVGDIITRLRDPNVTGTGKPPEETFNYDRIDGVETSKFIQATTRQLKEQLEEDKISLNEMRQIAYKMGLNPDKVLKRGRKIAENRELFAELISLRELMVKEATDISILGNKLNRLDITPEEEKLIIDELSKRQTFFDELVIVNKDAQRNVARGTTSGRVTAEAARAAELKVMPEDPVMKKLKQENPKEFYKRIALLDDDKQIIQGLQSVKDFNSWDLAAEHVNNNLLSSPDTHILNITSGLTQTFWKPAVMLLRSANLSISDRQRSASIARESVNTFIQQLVYTKTALREMMNAFKAGRPILDKRQLKVDNNITQGNLQRWMNATAETFTSPLGAFGRGLQKGIIEPATYLMTTPLRVLSTGDEFMKQMMFRGRMAAQIHELILKNHPEIATGSVAPIRQKAEYKAKFEEYQNLYIDKDGSAIDVNDLTPAQQSQLRTEDTKELNTPLRFAQEGTYTQTAAVDDVLTGKPATPNITQGVLDITSKNSGKWMRVMGLHFINTPSNLIRWNMQHLPLVGRFQLEMRQLLRMKDGSLFNPIKHNIKDAVDPEAAAEAMARIQAGYMIWGVAVMAAMQGKVTGGGSRDYRVNEEKTKTTGWLQYASRGDDGSYVQFNRLDPLATPFAMAADITEMMEDFYGVNPDIPNEIETQWTELSMGAVATIVRNMSSKFYTQNIIESANMLLSDDALRMRAPDRVFGSIVARGIYKFTPLSGSLRYANRVGDEFQTDLYDFTDRMKRLDPTGNAGVMPARDMFGNKVPRNKGWLFGFEVGSSPFPYTTWSNPTISAFFKDRDFNYVRPNYKVPSVNLDLRDIKSDTGQTAYDYMLESKSNVTFNYKGKKLKLKQYVEALIMDKKSPLYNRPSLGYTIDDMQQAYILSVVNKAEKRAWKDTRKKFPIIDKTVKDTKLFDIAGKRRYNKERFLENILDIDGGEN